MTALPHHGTGKGYKNESLPAWALYAQRDTLLGCRILTIALFAN
ncbi:transglutaminase-like family protein [Hassallia byssoidea VB512170]|uniref:Transglutaminase-like family protein n=2 Tax=Hassallia TaxID=482629 RepID=A0A846HIC3_9CYAN|nr:transglutaminase-like family protein [Hassalia byssoidea VB512170]